MITLSTEPRVQHPSFAGSPLPHSSTYSVGLAQYAFVLPERETLPRGMFAHFDRNICGAVVAIKKKDAAWAEHLPQCPTQAESAEGAKAGAWIKGGDLKGPTGPEPIENKPDTQKKWPAGAFERAYYQDAQDKKPSKWKDMEQNWLLG